MTPEDEAALFVRWRAGDRAACNTLVADVAWIAARVASMHGSARHPVDELKSEALWGIFRGMAYFDIAEGRWHRWAWISAKSAVWEHMRRKGGKHRRVPHVSLDDDTGNMDPLRERMASSCSTPESLAMASELSECFDAIGAEDLEILLRRDVDGCTYQEIGDDFGMTRQAAKWRHGAATAKLRKRAESFGARRKAA